MKQRPYDKQAERVDAILRERLRINEEYLPRGDRLQHTIVGIEQAVRMIMAEFGYQKPTLPRRPSSSGRQ